MKELIRQALARGYCSKRNEHKVLDPDLIEDMTVEVEKVLTEKPEKLPQCLKLGGCGWQDPLPKPKAEKEAESQEIMKSTIKPKNPPKIERLKGDWVTTDQKIDKMEDKINETVDWIDRHNDEGEV